MINTLLVEDDLYIQRHFIERFSEEEDIRIVAAVRDAFEAEGLCGQGGHRPCAHGCADAAQAFRACRRQAH